MRSIKTSIYQTQQIREIEHLARERVGISAQVMMQRAGKAAWDFLLKRWPQVQEIAVFCGAGNNGGDGYVLALLAHTHGLQVTIWQVGQQEIRQEEARQAFDACVQAKISIHPFSEKADLKHPDVVVDAICGIGVHDHLRDDVIAVIKKMQRVKAPIFALDIPTGMDADTGCLLGTAVHATATITFIGLKLGLLTGSGITYTGELVCDDLQLPTEVLASVQPVAEQIHLRSYSTYLKSRPRDWHKGLSGHVLIVGGEVGFSGAPRMAAEAALRVGAGLVSVATRVENAAMMNVGCPEIMCHGIHSAQDLAPLVAKASVIILGPGLGQSDWSQTVWTHLIEKELPLVIDADGLNLLSQTSKVNENWVLTPHPGEAARLLGQTSLTVQHNRLAAANAINKRYGGVCVLKGAGTFVLSPHSLPALCDRGNPGMASAGMGDVLSGVIGGLIAQGIPLGEAAKMGVVVHAMAGDLAAQKGERGMMATDLMPYLRRLVNDSSSG